MQPQVYSTTLTARLHSKFFQCMNCLLFSRWRVPSNIARNRARCYFPGSFCQRGSMPWTVDEIKSLISEIEDKPVLWKVFSDKYKDRVKKSEAWREDAAKLQRDQTKVSVSPTVQYYLFFDHCFCLLFLLVLAWLLNEINYYHNNRQNIGELETKAMPTVSGTRRKNIGAGQSVTSLSITSPTKFLNVTQISLLI